MSTTVIEDNPGAQRYELLVDGTIASLTEYRLHGHVADFVHTETREGFGGEGFGTRLIRAALDDARRRGWQVRPFCPFVKRFMVEHPEYQDLVPPADRADFFPG
ncbi:MAG: GNAT family N-acetyltransferase [Acidimicrobiales bacterium]